MIQYQLPGTKAYQERIYPSPDDLDPATKLTTYEEVILRFTERSLAEDGIQIRPGSLSVTAESGGYTVSFDPLAPFSTQAEQFSRIHQQMLDQTHGGLALAGADECRQTPAWNPMDGFPVSKDGPSKWFPCLPLGMPMCNHRAVTLLHYPPLIAYRKADYLNNNTLHRWEQILKCVGVDRPELYHAILDVDPIAASGSGQSEYPNDYLPINLTSLFFDNDKRGLTYVRAMLELMLNPPANEGNPCTLPLLVCGSPLYDPQAVGWFRTRYKDQLPKNAVGTPTADVLQAGFVRINQHSLKQTPYMIANHMIAAGVTGRCTNDPAAIPNIQKYEAQDLVAATFLGLCADAARANKVVDPAAAKAAACGRWFGAPDASGAPNPQNHDDRLALCALAQVDLCFDHHNSVPMFTFEQARARCLQQGGMDYSPCFGCASLPLSC
jgi:hypothetical protein